MQHTIDAQGKILGRVAGETAKLLMGKDKPSFSRHQLNDTTVVVYNLGRIRVSGKKEKTKMYRRHSGYPSGLREERYETVFQRSPALVFRHAVSGMLPKNKLRAKMLKHLVLYSEGIAKK